MPETGELSPVEGQPSYQEALIQESLEEIPVALDLHARALSRGYRPPKEVARKLDMEVTSSLGAELPIL
ncbi:MAG: hypothetical protein Q8R79_04565 [Legionellaceae bacterium]|nr:hypothetical protein [Legionellaceae bacterium]